MKAIYDDDWVVMVEASLLVRLFGWHGDGVSKEQRDKIFRIVELSRKSIEEATGGRQFE